MHGGTTSLPSDSHNRYAVAVLSLGVAVVLLLLLLIMGLLWYQLGLRPLSAAEARKELLTIHQDSFSQFQKDVVASDHESAKAQARVRAQYDSRMIEQITDDDRLADSSLGQQQLTLLRPCLATWNSVVAGDGALDDASACQEKITVFVVVSLLQKG